MGSYKNDWELLRTTMQKLALAGNIWLCRGAVRCDLLGELKEWDDFDIMTEASESALHFAIQSSDFNVVRTFHGGYSFRLPGGRKVDVWSMMQTRGQRCASLGEALSTFEFNVDAIARSIFSGRIVDPLGVQSEIVSRKLKSQGGAEISQSAYNPLKAVYLMLRHHFTPNESVVRLWQRIPEIDSIPEKAISALQKELHELGIHHGLDEVRAMGEKYPAISDYIKVLIPR